jgi:hypothetical protein
VNETERPQSSQLLTELRTLDTQLRQAGIRYAMIGGIAVNVHGFERENLLDDILRAIG